VQILTFLEECAVALQDDRFPLKSLSKARARAIDHVTRFYCSLRGALLLV